MMKILIYILLIAGGLITLTSSKIIEKFFKSEDENTNIVNNVKVKTIGFILVLLATVLIFFFV